MPLNTESFMKIGTVKDIPKETKFCLYFTYFLIRMGYNLIQTMQTKTYSLILSFMKIGVVKKRYEYSAAQKYELLKPAQAKP